MSETLKKIEEVTFKNQDRSHRAHLGFSILASDCSRSLWYSFRWCSPIEFEARVLRLFERGQLEEERFNKLLKEAGVEAWEIDPDTGEQFRVSHCAGHLGGSLDGVLLGVFEAPSTPHVSEQKTHNDRSFKDLQAKGVKVSKPQHYGQMQLYMYKMDIQFALYQAVNKNDDELYFERIELDRDHAERLLKRGESIVTSSEPLPKISDDAAFFKCKFCDHRPVCHLTATPEANCRTCVHSTPMLDGDGRWHCERHSKDLTTQDQREGCQYHLMIPPLLETWATPIDSDYQSVTYNNILTGNEFINGKGGYSSKEIAACQSVEIIGNPIVDEIKNDFDAKVVG